jgi:Protein of unknown function (DUF3435)
MQEARRKTQFALMEMTEGPREERVNDPKKISIYAENVIESSTNIGRDITGYDLLQKDISAFDSLEHSLSDVGSSDRSHRFSNSTCHCTAAYSSRSCPTNVCYASSKHHERLVSIHRLIRVTARANSSSGLKPYMTSYKPAWLAGAFEAPCLNSVGELRRLVVEKGRQQMPLPLKCEIDNFSVFPKVEIIGASPVSRRRRP